MSHGLRLLVRTGKAQFISKSSMVGLGLIVAREWTMATLAMAPLVGVKVVQIIKVLQQMRQAFFRILQVG